MERSGSVTVSAPTNWVIAARLPAEVVRILDVKPPGSGEETRDFAYLEALRPHDEVKFVIASRQDFDWSLAVARAHRLPGRVPVLLSPVQGVLEPKALVAWLLESGVEARLSLQIHKVVWGPEATGV